MNVDISHALFRDASGKPHIFENFFVHARNIRYVHIPPQVINISCVTFMFPLDHVLNGDFLLKVDMKKAVQSFFDGNQIKKYSARHSSLKGSRIMRRQAETVERVRKLKEKSST